MLIVVDLVLVWAAFAAGARQPAVVPPVFDAGAASETRAPASPSTATPTPEPSAAPDAGASTESGPSPAMAAPSLVLAALDDRIAYRAPAGECPAVPAAVEVTTDGGATWSAVPVGDAFGVIRIEPSAEEIVDVLAGDAACQPGRYRSWVQGIEWQFLTGVQPWRLSAGAVVAPDGRTFTPCSAPVQVEAATDASVAVACTDARVAVTEDGGGTWQVSEPISGLAAVADDGESTLVLIEGQGGCAGVQVAGLDDAGVVGTPGGCLAAATINGGGPALAISENGTTVWVVGDGIVGRSGDRGATW
ncbi:hypothetical protein ACGGZK_17315 [Agromyces sp. MMS24-K17]|uniref:hypothetical protein n=1 Tax=Agromyces sp. MMS24-K17 TaxID=3372850 RepID=UPI003754727D